MVIVLGSFIVLECKGPLAFVTCVKNDYNARVHGYMNSISGDYSETPQLQV